MRTAASRICSPISSRPTPGTPRGGGQRSDLQHRAKPDSESDLKCFDTVIEGLGTYAHASEVTDELRAERRPASTCT